MPGRHSRASRRRGPRHGEVPTPTPKDREILIKVGAAALNPVDTYIRSGMVKMPSYCVPEVTE